MRKCVHLSLDMLNSSCVLSHFKLQAFFVHGILQARILGWVAMLSNRLPQLRDWMEKATALHSSTLAWKIPWMEKPGRLQSMGSLRVGHDWVTSLSLFTYMHWRRKWQLTPVFLPGESQGRGSLVGCCLWGRTESNTTERRSSSSAYKNLWFLKGKSWIFNSVIVFNISK